MKMIRNWIILIIVVIGKIIEWGYKLYNWHKNKKGKN